MSRYNLLWIFGFYIRCRLPFSFMIQCVALLSLAVLLVSTWRVNALRRYTVHWHFKSCLPVRFRVPYLVRYHLVGLPVRFRAPYLGRYHLVGLPVRFRVPYLVRYHLVGLPVRFRVPYLVRYHLVGLPVRFRVPYLVRYHLVGLPINFLVLNLDIICLACPL
jgi:hypothetical protein